MGILALAFGRFTTIHGTPRLGFEHLTALLKKTIEDLFGILLDAMGGNGIVCKISLIELSSLLDSLPPTMVVAGMVWSFLPVT